MLERELLRDAKVVRLGLHVTRATGWLSPRYRQIRRAAARARPASEERVAQLLTHAKTKVPYYRERIGAGDARLEAFPVLSREALRSNFADLLARDGEGNIPGRALSIIRTGGSTGIPASHVRSLRENAFWDGALFSRLLTDLSLASSITLFDVGLHPGPQPIVEGYAFPPYACLWFNFRGFFDSEMTAEALSITRYFRPDVISGLPSRLVQLLEHSEEAGLRPRPSVVISSYEQLTDSVRRRLEAGFECRVINNYGSAEAGLCAWECSAGRLHFEEDLIVAEILDEDDAPCPVGKVGRLVITSLKGTVMPLIRYESGDLASRPHASCSCGHRFASIERLEGRASSRAMTTSGRLVSPYTTLVHIDALNLAHYQVVQDRPGVLRVITEPGDLPSPEAIHTMTTRLSEWAGEPFDVKVEPTSEWVLSASGKRNPFVSRVDHG